MKTIVGICIAMPGLIESDTGTVIFSPDFGWKDVPLEKWAQERLEPFHVIVRNANRAQARWETRPGSNNKESTIFVWVSVMVLAPESYQMVRYITDLQEPVVKSAIL